jgi:hypothetical protein
MSFYLARASSYQKLNEASHQDHAVPGHIFVCKFGSKGAGGGTTLRSFLAGAIDKATAGDMTRSTYCGLAAFGAGRRRFWNLFFSTRAHGAAAVRCELLEIPGRARAVEETAQAVLCLVFFFFWRSVLFLVAYE